MVQAIFCQEERQYVRFPNIQTPGMWREGIYCRVKIKWTEIQLRRSHWGDGIAQADILFLCVGSMDSLSRSCITAFLEEWWVGSENKWPLRFHLTRAFLALTRKMGPCVLLRNFSSIQWKTLPSRLMVLWNTSYLTLDEMSIANLGTTTKKKKKKWGSYNFRLPITYSQRISGHAIDSGMVPACLGEVPVGAVECWGCKQKDKHVTVKQLKSENGEWRWETIAGAKRTLTMGKEKPDSTYLNMEFSIHGSNIRPVLPRPKCRFSFLSIYSHGAREVRKELARG